MSDYQNPSNTPTIGAILAPEFADAAARAGVRVITGADFREAAAAIVGHSQQIGEMFPIVVGDAGDPSLESWVSAVAQSVPGTVGFFPNNASAAAFVTGLPAGVTLIDLGWTVNQVLQTIGSPLVAGGDVPILAPAAPVVPALPSFPVFAEVPAVDEPAGWDTPVAAPAPEQTPVAEAAEEPVAEEPALVIEEPAVEYLPEPVMSLTDFQPEQYTAPAEPVAETLPAPVAPIAPQPVAGFDSWDTPIGGSPAAPEPALYEAPQPVQPVFAQVEAPAPVFVPAPVAPVEPPAAQWEAAAPAPTPVAAPVAPAQQWDEPVAVQYPAPVAPPIAQPVEAPAQPQYQSPVAPPVQQPQPWDMPVQQQAPQPFPTPFSAPAAAPSPDLAPAPDMNTRPPVQTGMPLPSAAQEFAFNPAAVHAIPAPAPVHMPYQQPAAAPVAADSWDTPIDGSIPTNFGPPPTAPRVDNSHIQTITTSAHSEVSVAGLFDGYKPAAWKGQVITSFSGKGGVGKTTCSIQLARVASEAGLRVILIDGNVGQGDILQYLRLNTADMTTIYDIALRIQAGNPQDVMRNGVIQPDEANVARRSTGEGLDDISFAIVAAAPSSVEDHRLVTNQLYNAVIDFAASNADLVILDTQIIEAGDRTNFVGEVILPLMRHGAFGLGISEAGIAGANNLLDRLQRLNNEDIDRRQLMALFNKVIPDGIAAAEASAEYFSTLATYVGHIPSNDEIQNSMNRGEIGMDDAALNATMNRVLYTVTGDRRFEEAALTHAASSKTGPIRASKFSLFKKRGNR